MINGASDGLNNFWSIFWLHRSIFLTLVHNNHTPSATASASVSIPGENWDSMLTFSLLCSLQAAALCSQTKMEQTGCTHTRMICVRRTPRTRLTCSWVRREEAAFYQQDLTFLNIVPHYTHGSLLPFL